jgi:uncharacterized protein
MHRLLIVSDTSALSALAILGWLDWLKVRWGEVAVPEAVWNELQRIGEQRALDLLLRARSVGWLTVYSVSERGTVERLSGILDPGESEAIALAIELKASALLIDEMDGREAARKLGVPTTGTLGLIVWAKRQGLVPSASAAMEALVSQARFFVSEAVRNEVLRLAGEL